jgi:hypothetical protein
LEALEKKIREEAIMEERQKYNQEKSYVMKDLENRIAKVKF